MLRFSAKLMIPVEQGGEGYIFSMPRVPHLELAQSPASSPLRRMFFRPELSHFRRDPMNYDALLVVSFGGPEGHGDVIPFLENVLRGRNVPRERLLAVAEHYYHFDGKSPINQQTRELISAIKDELTQHGPNLPVYWGNRNWHPMLADTLRQMKSDGIGRALAFVTSAYSSYSGCRQYREDIARAQAEVGEGTPQIDKLRIFFNHPGFLEATEYRIQDALAGLPYASLRSAERPNAAVPTHVQV